jgi:hypothetical protein
MPLWIARRKGASLVFGCGDAKLDCKLAKGSLSFTGMRKESKGFAFGEHSALWRMQLRDRHGTRTDLSSSSGDHFSYKAGRVLTLIWKNMAKGNVDVTVTVKADPGSAILRCRMQIANRGGLHTVWAIVFPALSDVLGPTGSHRNDVLITTDGFGSAIPDPIRQPKLTAWTNKGYPNGLQSMPFVAITNGGLGFYMGAHDPAAGLCRFQHPPDKDADKLPMSILVEPEDAGRAQRRIGVPQELVLGLFEGDWYNAAGIYRTWALRQKRAAQTVEQRSDIPAWSRATPLWTRLNFTPEPGPARKEMAEFLDVTRRFRAALGRDFAAHLYTWHHFPFDTLYPDYRPLPGMKGFVQQLQSSGVRVMPYINGRLFDADHPDWVREKAVRFAAKDAAPKLGSRAERLFPEVYGSLQPMVVMCPATRYWQDKIASTVSRLITDLGVDAVYVDQIAAEWSEVCSDPAHGHPLRGGGWWIEGYAEMMRKTWRQLRRGGRAKGILLTTECNADAYLDMFGNFLMLHGTRNHVVPLFPAVYGGRAPLFARQVNISEGLRFRVTVAQNILWGCQNGWFGTRDMEQLMEPKHSAELGFLKGLCDLYDRMLPFFDGGEMARPPELTGSIRHEPVVWNFCIKWPEKLSTVWASHWTRGRSEAIAIVNAGTRSQTVRLPLASGRADAWWASHAEGSVTFSGKRAEVQLPGRGMVLLRFNSTR